MKRRRGKTLRRLAQSDFGLSVAAGLIVPALRFVAATTPVVYEPEAPDLFFRAHAPMILTAWHGQAFMLPFLIPKGYSADVLASRHSDGEVIARVLGKLDFGVIRGSGSADPARMHERGAVAGFRAMKASLDAGRSVALTADFDRREPRKVSVGLIALARLTGRPLVPVAFVSSRRREIGSSWDRTTLTLPFGRGVCVVGDPVTVARDADEAAQEAKRLALEAGLNAAIERATARADGRG